MKLGRYKINGTKIFGIIMCLSLFLGLTKLLFRDFNIFLGMACMIVILAIYALIVIAFGWYMKKLEENWKNPIIKKEK